MVSSSVVWFSKEKPPIDHRVKMTYGGSLLRPRLDRLVPAETLRICPKWTRFPMKDKQPQKPLWTLGDYFDIKRGLATGSNKFFILPIEEIEDRDLPIEAFRPILPSPRLLPEDEIFADDLGDPVLERRLFLLDCQLSEEEIKEQFPTLGTYLEEGKAQGIADLYLCRHRSPWYIQEQRPATPFLCTYFGRRGKKSDNPFRFILNHSMATASNVYLMLYPKGPVKRAIAESSQLKRLIWETLDGLDPRDLLNEGRVYGGGLHKLEPRELRRVSASPLAELLIDFSDEAKV